MAKESVKNHFYGVPAENRAFVDRSNILANMEAALGKDSSGGCKILALTGLGGMGKTQLMLRYCYLHRSTYDFVFWLEVDGWSNTIDSFRKLAINLGLDLKKIKEAMIIEQVVSWLQMRTNWLLLLNNADDDEMDKKLFQFLPRIGGDIILTTRVTIPSEMAAVIHVDKMQEDEAICLLLDISSIDLVNQKSPKFGYAQEIVAELDYMPLATNLARAYISNTGASCQHYLNMVKTKRDILFKYYDEDRFDQYRYTVSTVWQISLDLVRAQNPTSVQILKACTFFHPENIPVRFFEHQYSALERQSTSLSLLQESEQSCEAIRKAIIVLENFSFITRSRKEIEDEEGPTSDLLTIHRLVQKVIYDKLSNDQKLHWAHKIATALNSQTFFSSFHDIFSIQTQSIMNEYLSHIRHFILLLDNLDQKPLMSKDLRDMLDQKVYYLLKYGIYFGTEELAQLSIQISEAVDVVDGFENPDFTMSLDNLARFYEYQEKYNEAEPLYRRSLAICEELGSENRKTALSLSNLASLYDGQGKYNEAEPLYLRALAIYEKVLGSRHSDTATSLNNLASVYNKQGKYDEAEPLYQRALATSEEMLGSEHPDTAASVNKLALLYNNQGKYDEAELLYQRALAIREKVLGSEHPDTAGSLNRLAGLYHNQGKYDEAEPLYQRALAIREEVLGSEPPDIAHSLNNLACFYYGQDKYDEAEPLYQRALAICEKVLGSEHPTTASSLNNLASLYGRQDKYDEAETLYQRALAIREKVLGSEHPNTVASLNDLASLYDDQDKYDEAESLYQRALAIREKVLGSEHPDTAESLRNLALVYEYRSKYDEAEPLYQRALAIWEKLGSEHPDSVMCRNDLVTLYERQGRYEEAQSLRGDSKGQTIQKQDC